VKLDLLLLVFVLAALFLQKLGRDELRAANVAPGATQRKSNGKLVAGAVMIALAAVFLFIRGIALLR
jgi:hypothetical protein